jgi:CubicO group peptidase (beta-lactamase class C family)
MTAISIDELFAAIDEEVAEHLSTLTEATLMVGLTVRGERRVRSYRSDGAELAVEPTLDSVYEIGSVSKVFLATVLAALVNEGRMSLDDTLGALLPNGDRLSPEIAGLRVRDLVTHTAGVPSVGAIHQSYITEETRGYDVAPFGITTHYLRYRKEHLYQDWESIGFDYPTGTAWNYSVISMGTVGHLLELVTGQTFEELLVEHVCKPLGLLDTRYDLSPEQQERVVRAFFPHGKPAPNWYHDVLMPQGGLRSTMNDLLAFAEANIAAGTGVDDSPLAKAMRLARTPVITRPRHLDPSREVTQALAWRGVEGHPRASEHGGVTLFYQTGLAVDDESEVGLVMVSSAYDNMHTLELIAQALGNKPLGPRFLSWFDRACGLS